MNKNLDNYRLLQPGSKWYSFDLRTILQSVLLLFIVTGCGEHKLDGGVLDADSSSHGGSDSYNDTVSDRDSDPLKDTDSDDTGLDDTGAHVDSDTGFEIDTESDSKADTEDDTGTESDVVMDTGTFVNLDNISCDKGTYEGDVSVSSQTELEAYYGYTAINGYVTIKGVVSLEGMTCLQRITMDLTIDSTFLHDFSGLENLTAAGKYLYIYSNDYLTDITAFGNITDSPDVVRIQYNPVLEDIDFSFLKVIEELTLSYNDSLAQVDLSSLIAVNKAWWGRLEITNNPVLETIDLSMLQTVTYILRIAHNDLLLSIDLPAFTTGEASVTIDRNYLMTTFTTGATHLGSLSFYDTPVYTFSAPNLESISRDLVIAYCTFSSLSLDSLTIVGEDLSFYLNQSLTALSLPLLTTVGETFSIWGNRLLSCDYGTYQAQVTATLPFDVCDNGPLDACGPDTCP